ncbi:MAG: pilin [Patescibacteria group bacterium]|nr:pilin [Patescibacteria group bacterium]
MNKMLKMLMIVAMTMSIAVPALAGVIAAPAYAIDINTLTGGYDVSAGLNNTDPRTIAANIIKIALGFLGVLAVVIILIGGFKWMTAAGNEEQIEEAKKVLMAGIIGLVIILASWGIANFVLSSLISSI